MLMNYGEGSSQLSASDVALLTGRNNSGYNDGFGGENSAWWIILFLIFGWGRNGFGGGFGGGNQDGIGSNYVLATDFATIERKLDGINNGICDSTFALNNTINTGFFGVQNALCQGFNGLNVAYLQGTNSLSSQLANCCCDLRAQLAECCCGIERGIDGINYNNVINTNAIQQTLCNNTRDIIENANANYRAIHEELVANKLEAKNDRIAEQQNEINALRLKASQEAQNAYLLNELKPCPSAAYIVPNPNCCYNYAVTPVNNCGCGSY
jgi:hypothetical protein